MEINPLTVLATMINFVILYFALRHFLFKPVSAAIYSREKDIKDSINKAMEAEQKAEALRKENEENVKNAKEQGKILVEDFKARAEKMSEDILNKARQEAEFIIERAKADAEREKEKTLEEIKIQAIDIAVLLSSKALEKAIDEQEHRRLIKDFIAKVGN